jgi:hypothetical protein
MSSGTIAVDFDGVIHKYSKGWQDGAIYDEPVEGTSHALAYLMQRWAVYVHTTRQPDPVARWIHEKLHIPVAWFASSMRFQIPRLVQPGGAEWPSWAERMPEFWNEKDVLLITNVKLPALVYIDDRGLRFSDWESALDLVDGFTRTIERSGDDSRRGP